MKSNELHDIKPEEKSLERKFITVLFCDMVGSTALSERLDPEDLNDIFHLYREAAFKVVHKYHGHIARVIGDGLLVYFGYPATYEDDAVLAVRAGLEIISALKDVSQKTREMYGELINVRIGVHTGLVVIENIGIGQVHQQSAVFGITPNVAARLQEIADPDQLIISSVTWRLLKFQFNTISLGSKHLKGIIKPVQVFRVTSFDKNRKIVPPAASEWLTPRVDRETEINTINCNWKQAVAGKGQTVLVIGQAGIGKSRLITEFITQLPQDSFSLFDYFGSEYHQNTAFYPIIDKLQRNYDFELLKNRQSRHQVLKSIFAKDVQVDDKIIEAFETYFSRNDQEVQFPTGVDPQDIKVSIRKAMFYHLASMAKHKPVLVWVDDYQWLDFTSREVLHSLIHEIIELPILLIITSRPDKKVGEIEADFTSKIDLGRFSRQHCQELCSTIFGRQVPSAKLLELVTQRSEGVPLFLEELSASILELSWSDATNGSSPKEFTSDTRDIPTSLTATIMARLERLGEAMDVAQAAAVQGQFFSSEILGIVTRLDDESLAKSLKLLLHAGLIVPQDKTGILYKFKHALVKEVAVQSLVKNRRRALNLAVAKTIESEKLEHVPHEKDLLGHYYEQAGEFKIASQCFLLAGRESAKKSANVEALNQLRKALDTLKRLPEILERDQMELEIQVAMIGPSIAALGYAAEEVENILTRALQLLETLPNSPLIFPVLFSRWAVFQVVGKTRYAYGVAQKTFELAEKLPDTGATLIAHRLLGTSLILVGKPADAITKLEKVRNLFNPQKHSHLVHICGTDPLVSANALLAFARWLTGSVKESAICARYAIDLSEKGGHANTIGYALTHVGILAALQDDVPFTNEVVDRLLHFATTKELPFWIANARAFQGWLLARSGNIEQALEIFNKGLNFLDQAGLVYWRPTYLSWIAQANIDYGEPAKALAYLEEASNVIAVSEEHWMESEIWRLKGLATILEEGHAPDRALTHFETAINIAADQKAISLELRAVSDISKYLLQLEKTDNAKKRLTSFFATDMLDSSDKEVKDARKILAQLTNNMD